MAAISTLVDGFDGVSTTPDAGLWTTAGTTGDCTALVDTTGHTLVLTRNTSGQASISSVAVYDLTGSAIIFGPLTLSGASGTAVVGVGGGGSSLSVQINVATGVASAVSSPGGTLSTRTHAAGDWYRISESGGTVAFEYSTDGTTWTAWTTTAPGFAITAMNGTGQALSAAMSLTIGGVNPGGSPPAADTTAFFGFF